jgi:DNA helicase INO80
MNQTVKQEVSDQPLLSCDVSFFSKNIDSLSNKLLKSEQKNGDEIEKKSLPISSAAMNLLSVDVMRPQMDQSSLFDFRKPDIEFGKQEIIFYTGQFSLDHSELFELKCNKENLTKTITLEDYKRMKEENKQINSQGDVKKRKRAVSLSASTSTKSSKKNDADMIILDSPRKRSGSKKQKLIQSYYNNEGQEERDLPLYIPMESSKNKTSYNKNAHALTEPKFNAAWATIQNDIAAQHAKIEKVKRRGKEQCKKKANLAYQELLKRGLVIMEQEDDSLGRSRKLFAKVASHVKKNEVKNNEQRRRRMELEREKQRKSKKLNYLITRTELYSHFMAKRVSSDVGDVEDLGLLEGDDGEELPGLIQDVQKAINESDNNTKSFDFSANQHRKGTAMDDMNTELTYDILEPQMFQGRLKEYQKGGLNWLVNLYDQGINGILADEMGLGKTVQTIAFLGHLAERKGIWGPFLVIAPKSTLPNWCREIQQFTGGQLKVLPYWGSVKQRKILRKSINPHLLYTKHAPFHVLVTSYQMIVTDKNVFGKIKWEYMVLDEAQAIKSAHSQRWTTMLSLLKDCRNRLLLTGTPIQNNMGELWALLHFIMPTLFDNHQEFADWFSKDIESHAENKASNVNQHQLHRLYLVLKPFMLRREKKDVADEMPSKTEIEIHCSLTSRQEHLYNGIRQKLSVADLLDQARNSKNVKSLMNLVMQFRKVCNHPELLDRKETTFSFCFANVEYTSGFDYLFVRAPNRNPIEFTIPRIIFNKAMFPTSLNISLQSGIKWTLHYKTLFNLFSIFTRSYIASSLQPKEVVSPSGNYLEPESSCWSFLKFCDQSPSEVEQLWSLDNSLASWAACVEKFNRLQQLQLHNVIYEEPQSHTKLLIHQIHAPTSLASIKNSLLLTDMIKDPNTHLEENLTLTSTYFIYRPKVMAPTQSFNCSSQVFAAQQRDLLYNRYMCAQLNGVAHMTTNFSPELYPISVLEKEPNYFEGQLGLSLMHEGRKVVSSVTHYALPPILPTPLGHWESQKQGANFIKTIDFGELVRESSKMKILLKLLIQLKKENHRVLVYSQMTSMLDILEDFLSAHSYKFVRLDGSYGLDARQEMVDAFQNNHTIFVFLLSTRAGGLGINLTSADTVIFFDSDWNPTIDRQAMDRSHRIGQTKPVTVYRLVTSNTVEARILERAKQKHRIQTMVMTGECESNDDKIWGSSEMVDLLLQDGVNNNNGSNNNTDTLGRKRRTPSGFTMPRQKKEKVEKVEKEKKEKPEKKEKKERAPPKKKAKTSVGVLTTLTTPPVQKENNNNIIVENNNNAIVPVVPSQPKLSLKVKINLLRPKTVEPTPIREEENNNNNNNNNNNYNNNDNNHINEEKIIEI